VLADNLEHERIVTGAGHCAAAPGRWLARGAWESITGARWLAALRLHRVNGWPHCELPSVLFKCVSLSLHFWALLDVELYFCIVPRVSSYIFHSIQTIQLGVVGSTVQYIWYEPWLCYELCRIFVVFCPSFYSF
jgi:hypothetical protein